MNKRIRLLANKAGYNDQIYDISREGLEKFAELIVEATLDAVAERAYYTGDRDWSNELDRPWVQLEFGLGTLAEAQRKAGFKHE